MTSPERRGLLAQQATDYVLEHGLVELSLRPLAEALDTSDRMLIYHFGSKDMLVAEILRIANDRAVALLQALPPSPGPRQAVIDLWGAVAGNPTGLACARVYIESAAMGYSHVEPFVTVLRGANEQWTASLRRHLVNSGVPESLLARVVTLLDAAFFGFMLDVPLDHDASYRDREVRDLADAVSILAHPVAARGLMNWGG